MKTTDFISLLSAGVAPVERHVAPRRFSRALVLGSLGSIVLMLLFFGVRPDIRVMLVTPLFWAKLAFPLVLAGAALLASARLSRPGIRPGNAWVALSAPLFVVWIAALISLWLTPEDQRVALLMGVSWRTCPFNIALLSIPSFIAVFWAMRGLAPTRLRLAGAIGGLLAGAAATVVYCLHCPEMGVPFWGVWYVLGIGMPTLLGALLGPRLLRW
ncbi:DUF1109 domain-containing protein [Herbaspirillum sp. RTI4]|uniref:DUF1109 domain-containing protein n=1 Tax=Herbaspirillum sp. RTI4 TaxID=3048640 RepID=UPI002AB34F2A|nr:DUF1109 domain-containing protein [Herbaspirillum sp. RTI4]MDY7577800.1 DUF1109 domain-containing protein [Herbaspirillum sp. RTI4]MEA9980772.1 DUF1109 domain-containing protein [Herbaspirillum sp. RTI4]